VDAGAGAPPVGFDVTWGPVVGVDSPGPGAACGTVVVGAGRGRQLPKIIDRLVERAAAAKESVVGEVRSAVPLTDDQKTRLAAALSKATGKRVEVKVIVDPAVIGGLLVRVGDQVFDGTVRRRLQMAKEQIGRASNG